MDGIPGLNLRGVTTTVDLREGQWLAIAGLIQDEQSGSRTRVPFIGDIPWIGAAFGSQTSERRETELVILVSPELVHPMENKVMNIGDARRTGFTIQPIVEWRSDRAHAPPGNITRFQNNHAPPGLRYRV